MAEEGDQFKWSTVESVDAFAVGQDNLAHGKCGWDAARQALIDIDVLGKDSTLKDYRDRLVEFAKECKCDEQFVWEGWTHPFKLKELRKKVEEAFTGRNFKKSDWYAVDDFMLACGCFQVPIFIYHDWKDRRGKLHNIPPEVEVSSDGFTTEIFIPQGNGGALAIRRPGITLPFQMKSVCIQLKTFHFQWLKVRPTNNTWSKCKEEEKVCFTYFFNTTTILAK